MTATVATESSVAAAEAAHQAAADRAEQAAAESIAAQDSKVELHARLADGDHTVEASELVAADAAVHRASLLADAAATAEAGAAQRVQEARVRELVDEAHRYLDTKPEQDVKRRQAIAQAAVDEARAAEAELTRRAMEIGQQFRAAGLSACTGSDTNATGWRGHPFSPVVSGFSVAGSGVTVSGDHRWSPTP